MAQSTRIISPDGLQEDVLIYPVLVALAGCLAAEFKASGLGDIEPNIAVGAQYALELRDDCDTPDVWVRLSSAYPSTTIPIADVTPQQGFNALGFLIEVGTARCLPDPGSTDVYSSQDYLTAVRLQMAEMAAMRRAICGCLGIMERTFVLTDYQPQGPEGGMVWGSWQVNVAMPGA